MDGTRTRNHMPDKHAILPLNYQSFFQLAVLQWAVRSNFLFSAHCKLKLPAFSSQPISRQFTVTFYKFSQFWPKVWFYNKVEHLIIS